jgi:hypothetical protein
MKVHRFECDSDHVFFIPLGLPTPLDIAVNLLMHIDCPVCKSVTITLSAQEFTVS